MRQTVRAAGILSIFLLTLTNLSAEPVIRGFFVEKLPKQVSTKKLAPGKGLVLAHVFNSGNEAMTAGKYQVGIEIENSGKKQKFALKPTQNIVVGALKTFRMSVPVSEKVKANGSFRVFSKIDGKFVWSEKYSFLQGIHSSGENGIRTLYTEAPPEPGSVRPPAEIPFENELNKTKSLVQVSKASKQKLGSLSKVVSPANIASIKNASKNKVAAVEENKLAAPVRNIDPSEFKKLRTIDEELIIYVIKDGDTLKSIAQKYYGTKTRERAIADLNFIENPASVKVGEEIIVDVKPLGKSEAVKKAVKSSKIGQMFLTDDKTYTIKKGDTLGKIAKNIFGKSSAATLLLEANPGLTPRNLKIGDVLMIPENRGDKA